MTPSVVAIDGPAASGKSSTAAAVARRLGWLHVDSGALYRAVTWMACELGDPGAAAPEKVLAEADRRGLRLEVRGGEAVPVADGDAALGNRIRSGEVTAAVSAVAARPAIRAWVNRQLQVLAERESPLVMDGRDIGTAVFPDAPVKVFLVATPEVRAFRRLLQRGEDVTPERITAEAARIAARDGADSTREAAPLHVAADARVLDTTALAFEQQVDLIVGLIRERGLPPGGTSG